MRALKKSNPEHIYDLFVEINDLISYHDRTRSDPKRNSVQKKHQYLWQYYPHTILLILFPWKNDKINSQNICYYAFEKRDRIAITQLAQPFVVQLKGVLSRRNLLIKHRIALKSSLKEQKSSLNKKLCEDLAILRNSGRQSKCSIKNSIIYHD